MSTTRQHQMIEAIRALSAAGLTPTHDRLQERLGLASRGAVNRTLNLLRKAGKVTWEYHRTGTLRLVEGPSRAEMERWSDEEVARVAFELYEIEASRTAARVAA